MPQPSGSGVSFALPLRNFTGHPAGGSSGGGGNDSSGDHDGHFGHRGGDDHGGIDLLSPPTPPVPPEQDSFDRGGGDDGDAGPWTTVATFWHPAEAHIARLRLESAGVPCLLLDEHFAATHCLAIAAGGIKLQVPATMVDEARELLARCGADRPVELARFAEAKMAKIAACVVEAEGIKVELRLPDHAALPATLGVAREDFVRAAIALRRSPARGGLVRLAAKFVPCPICDSVDTRWQPGLALMIGLLRQTLRLLIGSGRRVVLQHHCRSCGHTFRSA